MGTSASRMARRMGGSGIIVGLEDFWKERRGGVMMGEVVDG